MTREPYTVGQLILFFSGLVLNLLAGVLAARYIRLRTAAADWTFKAVAILAALGYAGFLAHVSAASRRCPLESPFEIGVVFSALLLPASLAVDRRLKRDVVTAFAAPLTFLVSAAAFLLLARKAPPPAGWKNPGVAFHVSLLVLAYGAFALAFLTSIIFLIQERFLKTKRVIGLFFFLPPLETLERASTRAIAVGFPLLTLGILLGALATWRVAGVPPDWWTDPKVPLTFLTWASYGFILHVRMRGRERGRRPAWLAVAGFCFILFTYFGAGFLWKGFHSF
jgi:ABC-type transport system involved in cytochrome c biogenesis permease subunit